METSPGMYPLLPPGMDASHVDLRTFYPYTPNDVKHRKRTTSAQLKVLEAIFKTDTKPNGALRQRLAVQLDMTPRGVQVWFQNRRAKEKLKASKAAAAQASANNADSTGNRDNGTGDDAANESDNQSTETVTKEPTEASAPSAGPIMTMRRPSLPVNQLEQLAPPNFDPMARRRSVDPNLLRYPYSGHQQLPSRPSPYPRPQTYHRPSMPLLPTASLPNTTGYVNHGSLPDASLYMATARPVPSPIPGPLPQPDFSFGAASSALSPPSNDSSERNSPDSLQRYSFPNERHSVPEFEDDGPVYVAPASRFGSITSIASGESAYFSDVGSEMYPASFPAHRKSSSTSSHQFLGMMSNLDVSADSVDAARRFSLPGEALTAPYSSQNPGSTMHSQIDPRTFVPQGSETQSSIQYTSPQAERTRPSSTLSGGSPNMTNNDGTYYYGSSGTPAGTPESQFSHTTPDPGSALPNLNVPFDMSEFAHAPAAQQKFNTMHDMAPPAIVSTAGCYDTGSITGEPMIPYHHNSVSPQIPAFAWG